MSQVMLQLTQHMDEFVHYNRDLILEHDEDHKTDIDNIKGADQLVGNRITYIPFLECDAGRESLGRWRCIKRDVEANELC